MLRKFLKKIRLVKSAVQEEKELTFQIITGDDVLNHYKKSAATEFMCKNCGSIHNALAVSRIYCSGCGFWLCWKCTGDLCAECKQ